MLTSRRGFSMIEIVTALLIIALLTGIITPVVMKRIRYAQAQAAAETFEAIRKGVQDFRSNVGEYPSRITQLLGRPDNSSISAIRLCGGTVMPVSTRLLWKGPYLARYYAEVSNITPTYGATTGEWRIFDQFVRVGNTAATDTARIFVRMPNVPLEDANRINAIVDGPASEVAPQAAGVDTAGALTWSALQNASTTVSYGIIVRGC